MGRYHYQYGHKQHYGQRGFHPFMLIFPLLFLLVFGGLIFKLLLWIAPVLLVLWLVRKLVCSHHDDDRGDKLKNDDMDDKPKRRYVETSDGQWVEII